MPKLLLSFLFILSIISCNSSMKDMSVKEKTSTLQSLHLLVDNWHHAAATADEDTFFGSMTSDGIYIGTDASEYWLRDELKRWSEKYFERDSAWVFHPRDRHLYLDPAGHIAWFDELLDTWMGDCRGSGVLERQIDGRWLIKHYHLSIAVPNDAVQEYLKILGDQSKPKE